MKVLIAGESWTTFSTHIKGVDTFMTSSYADGVGPLRDALEAGGHTVEHMPGEHVVERFPFERAALDAWDVIVISDVGANSFVLANRTYKQSQTVPDRLGNIADWTRDGGGLVMVGGYLSFTGYEGKARYGSSPLADVLPVTMLDHDDRAERPGGVPTRALPVAHELLAGIEGEWPHMLGYNRLLPREGADVLATIGQDDVLLASWEIGDGRASAFSSECAPHWAPPGFLAWEHYGTLWNNIVNWTGSARVPA